MAIGPVPRGEFHQDLRTLFLSGPTGLLTDGELLDRFLGRRDERAFAALVERHGPMVLRACRAVLDDANDVHDAFQATFLVLFRRAGAIRRHGSVASWLFGVARRVSLRARADAQRRRVRERSGAVREHFEEATADDLGPVLHEEVHRLPDRLKGAIVLCDLEGRTYEEAAGALGCPVGTIKSRLARGRDRLRERLARRGVTTPAGFVAAGLGGRTPPALPPGLVESTTRLVVVGSWAAEGASVVVDILARGVLNAMILTRTVQVAAVAIAVAGTVAGVAYLRAEPVAPEQARAKPEEPGRLAPPTTIDELRLALHQAARDAAAIDDRYTRAMSRLRIARGLAATGDRAGARDLLDATIADAESLPNMNWKGHVLGEAGVVLSEIDGPEPARKLFDRLNREIAALKAGEGMQAARERSYLVAQTADYQARAGDRDGALAVLRAAHTELATFESNDRLNALLRVLNAQADLGDFEGALRAIEGLEGEIAHWRDPALRQVLRTPQGEHRRIPKVLIPRFLDIASSIPYEVPRATAETEIAKVQAAGGDIEGALKTARNLAHLGGQFDTTDSVPLALAGVALEQNRQGDREGAIRTAREAFLVTGTLNRNDDVIPPERMRRVAEAQAEIGDLDGATASAEAIGNPYEKTYGLAALATAQARAGRNDEALATFRRAIATAETIGKRESLIGSDPNHDRQNARYAIVTGMGRSGFRGEAKAFIDSIDDRDWQSNARGDLTGSLSAAGDLASALASARSIADGNIRGQVLAGLADRQVKAGDLAGVLKWAAEEKSADARAEILSAAARASRP